MNNFTPRAQQVLALARKEADRFNHNYVGTEHLLLGLIKLGQGVAVNVLQTMGLDLGTVRQASQQRCAGGRRIVPQQLDDGVVCWRIELEAQVRRTLASGLRDLAWLKTGGAPPLRASGPGENRTTT